MTMLDEEKEELLELTKGNREIYNLVNHAFLKISEGQERILNSDIGKIEAKGAIPIATSLAGIAHREYPGNIYFVVKYGTLLLKNSDLDTANQVVKEYKNIYGGSGNQRFRFLEASILKNMGQYEEAIEIFEKLNTPQNEQFHVRDELAQCYYLNGNYDKAKSILEGGRRLSYDGALILAQIYMQEHSDEKAYKILKPILGNNKKIDSFFNAHFSDKWILEEEQPEITVSNQLRTSVTKFQNEHDPKKTVFIMMKFQGGDHQKDNKLNVLFNLIKLELNKYGLDAVKADEKNYSDTDYLWDNVQIYMNGSAYGIAILENLYSDEMNPNAALEYGYMLALGNRVLLLKEKSFTNIRADILGKIWREFEFDDIGSIKNAITAWMVDLGIPRIKA